MNAPITQQFEIAFWDLVTQSLSQSRVIRYLVFNFYHLFHQESPEALFRTFTLVGLTGFFAGTLAGVVITLL